MARNIMIQGTMSNVGKSLLCAALCRVLRQDGYSCAPFKSQNMALNSGVTWDGLEMGRAQILQAAAAGTEPDVRMNPILLKPSSDTGSQVIIRGEIAGQYSAGEYFTRRKRLIPVILEAYESLAGEHDVIVIEGAGSPAEINLKKDDIVNMGLAELVDAPVLLAGDIDPGGVFAQLYGTVMLLEERERGRIRGLIINKFRGDISLLEPGIGMLEEKLGIPVAGVIPWMNLELDAEDSMALGRKRRRHDRPVDIAVIRFPRISNFTDFNALDGHPVLGLRYVSGTDEFGEPDMVILPGTKSTLSDLRWLRDSGLEQKILEAAAGGRYILGICGGYQMLGVSLSDPDGSEGIGPVLNERGLGLLQVKTVFSGYKTRRRVQGEIRGGYLSGSHVYGYEIHMGKTMTVPQDNTEGSNSEAGSPGAVTASGDVPGEIHVSAIGNICGTYLHGLFDSGEAVDTLAKVLAAKKGMPEPAYRSPDRRYELERQLDILADVFRGHADMERIYRIIDKRE